jgi:hypothetical protein
VCRFIRGVLVVLVEQRCPRDFLRSQVESYRTYERADGRQHLPGDVADRSMRSQWDPSRASVAVLHDRLVSMEVHRDDQGTGAVRCGK